MSLFKNVPARDPAYLAWVRTQPSVVSGVEGCVAHHCIADRFSSSKHSDYFTIPLTEDEHRELHKSWRSWEMTHGSQWRFVALTLERAVRDGFFSERRAA